MRWIALWVLATITVAASAQTGEHSSRGEAGKGVGVVMTQEEAPVVDGSVAEGEYGLSLSYDGITIGLALVGDTLHVAASAATTGWVGVGFGSDKMDGARIFFSFVDAEGNVFFAEQEGTGHKHRDVVGTVATAYAVDEVEGTTTLEATVPAAFVRGTSYEDGVFPMIVAYGRRDSVRVMHRFFKSIELIFG